MIKAFLRPIAAMLACIAVACVISIIPAREQSKNENIDLNGDTEQSVEAGNNSSSQKPYNLLVLGKDQASGLTDVMMLVSFDKVNNKAFVLQLLRDTYVNYGSSYCKLNGAMRALGEDGLCSFLESSMGIDVDGYISLELEGFRALVDSIGGVEMDITEPLKYSDPSQSLYIDLPAGRQILNGQQAEMLVRYRSGYARGDLDRLDVQKRFLAALFVTLKSKITPLSVYSVASAALPYLKTNISASELVFLGLRVAGMPKENVSLATLSGEDAVSSISGGSFFVVSKPSAEELLREHFALNGEFDSEGRFLHPSLDKFKMIYSKKYENRVFSLEELK